MLELSNFGQHILYVRYREGVTAGLGVEGTEIDDKVKLVRAGFGDGETWSGPWCGGGGDEAVLMESGDLLTHKLCVCWGRTDRGAGGRGSKSVDLERFYVSGVVEVAQIQCKSANMVVDRLVVWGPVVGW